MNGAWLSILEYARYKKISISTIRRYIKAGRVKFKSEAGKYFIFIQNYVEQTEQTGDKFGRDFMQIRMENEALKREIQRYQEEIGELRMLVSLYEKKDKARQLEGTQRKEGLPDLPNMM